MTSIEHKKNLRKAWAITSAVCLGGLTLTLAADPALAATALGDIGQNLGENFKQLGPAIKYGSAIVGAGFTGMGVKNIYDAQKGQGQTTTGAAVIKIGVGVCLLGLAGFAQMGSTTIFGSDQASGVGELGL